MSLSDKLLKYLKENNGKWVKKVELFIVSDNEGYSPETAGRALRELAEKGKIQVGYYDGRYSKNLAKYSFNPIKEKVRKVEIINGKPTIVFV